MDIIAVILRINMCLNSLILIYIYHYLSIFFQHKKNRKKSFLFSGLTTKREGEGGKGRTTKKRNFLKLLFSSIDNNTYLTYFTILLNYVVDWQSRIFLPGLLQYLATKFFGVPKQ